MRTGIALSGGGARGFAHLGALQAMNEMRIEIDEISGTSAGSIAAAFYANGYSPKEALDAIANTNLFKIIWPAFSLSGLINMSKSEEVFRKFFSDDTFSKTKIPLRIVATDLNQGKRHVFKEGPLVKAMIASSCIPFIFDPVKIGAISYVDGGIVNNLPSEVLRDSCDIVIGINVAPIVNEDDLGGPKKMIERISMVSINANVETSIKECDIIIEPKELRKFGTFDVKKANEIYQIGYDSTMHYFEMNSDNSFVKQLLEKAEAKKESTQS